MVGLGLAIDLLLTDARSSRKVFRSTFFIDFLTIKEGNNFISKMRAAFLLRIKSSPKCLSGAHPMRKQGRAWHFLCNGIVH